MEEYYEIDQMHGVLENGGLVLMPSDTSWGIGCDALDPVAAIRTKKLISEVPVRPVLLVNSIGMLKQWVGELHPRIETLLTFHQRPLTILYDDPVGEIPEQALTSGGWVAIRLVTDPFCQQLIGKLDRPLLFVPARTAGQPEPVSFGSIRSDIISGVDFVARHRQKEKNIGDPAVTVRLSEEAELVVVEE